MLKSYMHRYYIIITLRNIPIYAVRCNSHIVVGRLLGNTEITQPSADNYADQQ